MENNMKWELENSETVNYGGCILTLYHYSTDWGTLYTTTTNESEARYFYNPVEALQNK